MAKKDNDDKGTKDDEDAPDLMELGVEVSEQSVSMLEALSDLGIYGVTPEEVAGRFVDERLQELAGAPGFSFVEPGSKKK